MQIFVPDADLLGKCVSILRGPDAADQVRAIRAVADVIHEIHPMTPQLRQHPTVNAWRGYEANLLVHGIALCEKLANEELYTSTVEFLQPLLVKHLEWAFESDNPVGWPSWTKAGSYNQSHLSTLVTRNPDRYPDLIGKVPFGISYLWPGVPHVT